MSHVTNDQLSELTALINERLKEFDHGLPPVSRGYVRLACDVFEEYWETDSANEPDRNGALSDGALVAMADDACQEIEELSKIAHIEPSANGDGFLVTFPNATPDPPVMISRMPVIQSPMIHEPAYTQTIGDAAAPISPAIQEESGQPLQGGPNQSEADVYEKAELASMRMSKEEKGQALREVIHELQFMAAPGKPGHPNVMPSMAEYDENRPSHLPTAKLVNARHQLTWKTLAEYAKLDFRMGPKPKAGARDD